ncbi:hypothetical protein CMU71_12810 [Elizabethkingia anophelis]|uniref:hypothetical protein n=1 Tax=Elizabethkingia anophelis TaxID=1117645 RepID=UPI001F4A67E0|nr:hypothetical protein [Elizabethkingia anophelis]MDV3567782.1 hypothetical protein [Elizabethkingia anophelis]MDV3969451.1 hypothetical protein [Elizabethkingia anophelis]
MKNLTKSSLLYAITLLASLSVYSCRSDRDDLGTSKGAPATIDKGKIVKEWAKKAIFSSTPLEIIMPDRDYKVIHVNVVCNQGSTMFDITPVINGVTSKGEIFSLKKGEVKVYDMAIPSRGKNKSNKIKFIGSVSNLNLSRNIGIAKPAPFSSDVVIRMTGE